MAENIRVLLRSRGIPHPGIKVDGKQSLIEVSGGGNSSLVSFQFDRVFDQTSNQEGVFREVSPLIEHVCQGYNATIFAYGATSSGKTFTMFGDTVNPGIIPRACDLLFTLINSNDNVQEASLRCSFIEIYREQVRDLLRSSSSRTENASDETGIERDMKIRQSNKGVFVQGLIEKYVYSPEEILNVIKSGFVNRTTASTALNNVSSRSHALVTLSIIQTFLDGSQSESKLHLVDLAGSENVGRSEVQGISLLEAQTINKSLSCLGNVIFALTEKKRDHIPYRDSKLTFLLQDSIGGNSKTVLIATIYPIIPNHSETLSTLKFAKRAKEIRNNPRINRNESVETLNGIISELRVKIEELEEKLGKKQGESNISITSINPIIPSIPVQLLEKKVQSLLDEKEKGKREVDEVFKAQETRFKKLSDDLCVQNVKNYSILLELDQLRYFYRSVKDAGENYPELLPVIVNGFSLMT